MVASLVGASSVIASARGPLRPADTAPSAASWCSSAVGSPTWGRPGSYVIADNFESGSLGKWRVTDEGDAWAGVTSSFASTGECAGRLIVSSSSTSRANVRKSLPTGTDDVWAIGWFRVNREGYSGSNVPTFRFFYGSKRILDIHRQNLSGDLWLRAARGDGSWKYVKLGKRMDLNRWYKVEIHVRTAWGSSRVDVLVDGVLRYSKSGYYLPTARLTSVMVGAEHVRQKGDLGFDNIIVKAS